MNRPLSFVKSEKDYKLWVRAHQRYLKGGYVCKGFVSIGGNDRCNIRVRAMSKWWDIYDFS